MKKKIIPVKTRLKKAESFLFSLSSKLFEIADRFFNVPRLLDRVYLKRFFLKKYRFGLDIGAGKGSMARFLLRYTDKVVCLDKEKEEIAFLKKRFKNKQRSLSFVVSDARKLPFKRESFDLIFSNCVLEHIKDDEKVLAEISRCLKPGGKLIMALPNRQIKAGYFKSLVYKQPFWRFLVDPACKKYFAFSSFKEAEEWYTSYRWQQVRWGYSLAEIKTRLSRYHFQILDSIYFPNRFLSELWEIITFSRINQLFPYILLLFGPLFFLLPKSKGDKDNSLEFGFLAQKTK